MDRHEPGGPMRSRFVQRAGQLGLAAASLALQQERQATGVQALGQVQTLDHPGITADDRVERRRMAGRVDTSAACARHGLGMNEGAR